MWNNGICSGWGIHGGGHMMWFFQIIFLVAIAYLLFKLFTPNKGAAYKNDAAAILASRYAKGEIDDEEYATRKKMLK